MIIFVIGDINNTLLFFLASSLLFFCGSIQYPISFYIASNAIQDKASGSGVMSCINVGGTSFLVIVNG